MIILLVIPLLFGLVGATIAGGRGRSVLGWFVLSALFPPFILAVMVLPVQSKPQPTPPSGLAMDRTDKIFWGMLLFFGTFIIVFGSIYFVQEYAERRRNAPYEIRMGVLCHPSTGKVTYTDGLPFGMAFGAHCRDGKLRYTVPPTSGPFLSMYPPDP